MTLLASTDDLDIECLSGTNLRDCYQCGKCSAGCPMADSMDVLPNRLIRLVQLGQAEKAISAESIWKCVSCMTCTARCPKSVDCAGVMDALRQIAFERGAVPEARQRTVLFQKAFLDNIRRNGRLRELELVGAFKLRAFFRDRSLRALIKDSFLAPKLMQRGKLHFGGKRVNDRGVVGRIFAKCMSEGEK
ncbi:MAG: 4Fe-4S dicluster domain-containing protein [Thermoguttaceae bacterium]